MAAKYPRLALYASLLLASCLAGAASVDLTGFWVRTDEAGSGNFDGMLANIPAAQLQPATQEAARSEAAAKATADKQQEQKINGVYRVAVKCDNASITFMMQHSGAFDIVQNEQAVLVIPEHQGTQHIYLDGRPHPPLSDWQPSGAGHSIGHWEDGALVVSTVGMKAGGGIPAGGRKGPATELVERFQLRDPQHLIVRFTWNDPAIYTSPHSYVFTYEKQPTDSYAFESWCDVTDPLQGQSIVVPPQK